MDSRGGRRMEGKRGDKRGGDSGKGKKAAGGGKVVEDRGGKI